MVIFIAPKKEFGGIGRVFKMIIKSYRDDLFEIVIQQNESTNMHSVSLIKSSNQVEFQGNLDFETAMEVYDYYFDKMTGEDLTNWQGAIE